jgi:hypothetical protein
MPPSVARAYLQAPDPDIRSRVGEDPPVAFSEDVAPDDFYAGSLWEVPDAFTVCVEALLEKDLEALAPEDVQAHFADGGFPDFLPVWTDQDITTATEEGKIPVLGTWRDRLAARELGLDAVMQVSALCSFAVDQKALDDRIRSLL